MPRLLLPFLLVLLLGAAAPAGAQVISATKTDPAERPDDPGRDIESIQSSYDPAGTWTVHARFYGPPSTETRALLRAFLGVRAAGGACEGTSPATLIAVWTGPEDRGGKGFTDNLSFDVTKTFDTDGRGFTATFSDPRLTDRGACGVVTTSLSRNEPFDGVGAFEFAGAPTEPAPPRPGAGDPGTGPSVPGGPSTDTTPPSARLTVLRDAKSARRGVVRVNLLAATEPVSAAVTVRDPGRRTVARRTRPLAPNQMVTLKLRLDARALRRLRRTGRLRVEVLVLLTDAAGHTAAIGDRTTLRYRR